MMTLEDFIQMSVSRINEEYLPVFKQQTSFPAINIGHLGTRADLQSKGIGTKVLDFVPNDLYQLRYCRMSIYNC